MAYNTVADFAANEAPTAVKINDLLENLETLRAPAEYHYHTDAGYTTTSTSFTQVDATNLSQTLTYSGGKVLILLSVDFANAEFDLEVDGVRQGDATRGLWASSNVSARFTTLPFLVDGGLTGSKTIKLMWRTYNGVAGTATIVANVDTAFSIIELF